MLLRQLTRFRPPASEETASARPYSRTRTVRWQLNIDTNGRPRGDLVRLIDPDRPKAPGRPALVPNTSRTVGILPNLGVDDVQYVLGWVDDRKETKPTRVEAAHAAFVALCSRWATDFPDDRWAQALARFYDRSGPEDLPRPSEKWTSKDVVLVAVDGRPATDSESLWLLWQRVVEERKSGAGSDSRARPGSGRRQGLCLVCNTVGALLDRMPQALPKALLPRAEQEIALVSANKRIHTYDFDEGLSNAPICTDCGRAAVANLTHILSDNDWTFTYPRQRTRIAWWVTGDADTETISMLDANPGVISEFLGQIQTGVRVRRPKGQDFCSITVSGNVARLVVHDWITMPLGDAEDNILSWFADHKIAHRFLDRDAHFPIWLLVTCAGQWLPGRNGSRGRYIPLHDRAADRPDDLAHLLIRSAIHHAKLPPHLLAHVVRRVATDKHIDEPRAALLRAALTRHPNPAVEKPMPGLDPQQHNPAYLAGRLFAALEAIQRAAYRKAELPNTTFFDRYFAGAIANPRAAINQGQQLSAAWLKKIWRTAESEPNPTERDRRRATHAALRKNITELVDMFSAEPLPARITTAQQSLFILGYHHQRAHDIRRATAGKAPELVDAVPDPADHPTDPEETQ